MARVLQMRLGDNYGDLLVDTAREALLCDSNPEKALNILMESIDCDEEQAKQLLSGEMFLTVCSNGFELDGIMYDANVHTDRSLFDFNEWCKMVYAEVSEEFKTCKIGLNRLGRYVFENPNRNVIINVSLQDVMQSIVNKSKHMVDAYECLADSEKTSMFSILEVVDTVICELMPKALVIKWLYANIANNTISPLYIQSVDLLSDLVNHIDMFREGNIPITNKGELAVELDKKLGYAKEIEEIVVKGIEPVNMEDNYTSGWLSPDGEYYALNGVVSNMLHNTIADALCDKGIVPETASSNPDAWLEANGWAKIQGDKVTYCGWLGLKGNPIVPMTVKQKRAIANYGNKCHDGKLILGFYDTEISARKFGQIEIPMLRSYFV
ncbi:MAG: hypothetical protein ACRDD8_10495 [Bacteroidales bacterium]